MTYGIYFINGMVYDTVDDRCVAAKDIALGLGFQLKRGSHKKNPRAEEKHLYLYCSHYGRSPSQSITSSESSRTTTTSFTSCTFMVCVRPTFVDAEWKWRIDTVKDDVKRGIFRSFHNHHFELWREGTQQRNQLTDEMKDHIRQLEEYHVPPRQMQSILNNEYGRRINIRQIYNETVKIRRSRLGTMNPMQWAVTEARKMGYFTKYIKDSSDHVSHLYVSHAESVRMLHAWYFVILIDSTYKTNIYKKAVVQFVGVTPVKKNFNIGLALLEDETTESYIWALHQLRLVLGGRVPNAFVTDKERGLAVALEDVFPSLAHLMCVWHMKQNIEGRITRLYVRDVAEKFVRGPWGQVLNARTTQMFFRKWSDLEEGGWSDELIQYLASEWLP